MKYPLGVLLIALAIAIAPEMEAKDARPAPEILSGSPAASLVSAAQGERYQRPSMVSFVMLWRGADRGRGGCAAGIRAIAQILKLTLAFGRFSAAPDPAAHAGC